MKEDDEEDVGENQQPHLSTCQYQVTGKKSQERGQGHIQGEVQGQCFPGDGTPSSPWCRRQWERALGKRGQGQEAGDSLIQQQRGHRAMAKGQ